MNQFIRLCAIISWITVLSIHIKIADGQQCSAACHEAVETAKDDADKYHRDINDMSDALLRRIVHLQQNQNDADVILASLQDAENQLNGYVTATHSRLTDLYTYLDGEIRKVEAKIPIITMSQTTGGNQDAALQNLEVKLTNLIGSEQSNLKNLTDDNKTWRANFRTIRDDFAKLKQKNVI